MGVQFFWFYDILAVVLMGSLVYFGWKKGFLRTLFSIAGFALAFALATMVSTSATPVIYDSFVKPVVITAAERQLDSLDVVERIRQAVTASGAAIEETEIREILVSRPENLVEALSAYMERSAEAAGEDVFPVEAFKTALEGALEKANDIAIFDNLPEYMVGGRSEGTYEEPRGIESYIGLEAGLLKETLGRLGESNRAASEYLEEEVFSANVQNIVSPVVFLLTFALACALFNGFSRLFKMVNRIPLVGPVNRVLGGILGGLQGIIILFIMGMVVNVLVIFTNNSLMIFNQATLAKTIIFKYFCPLSVF